MARGWRAPGRPRRRPPRHRRFRAPGRALRLARALPAGPDCDEIEQLARIVRGTRTALDPGAAAADATSDDEAPEADAGAKAPGLGRDDIDGLGGWALRQACLLLPRLPDGGCAAAPRVAERLAELHPDDPRFLDQLIALALRDGDLERAATLADCAAAAADFEPGALDELLARLAPVAEERRPDCPPALAAAMAALAARLPIYGPPEPSRARRYHAGWRAAQAALTADPATAVTGWREAITLDPARAPFHRALAAALERAGRDEARASRRRADQLDGLVACPDPVRVCFPQTGMHGLPPHPDDEDDD